MFEVGDLVVERETIFYAYSIGIIIEIHKIEYNLDYNTYDTLVTVMWMDKTTEVLETKFLWKLGG
tara:strand:- start:346 stop:540 length:195 start_codon:yes stop_codon:yes gene_type:complete